MTVIREEELGPAQAIAPISVAWSVNARPGQDPPGHVFAAQLLASSVDHLKVAGEHAQEQLVPIAADRLELVVASVLEDLLPPASVAKVIHALHDSIVADLRVLAAEINADARKVLHRRMATELAVKLIPLLDGGQP